MVDRNRRLFLRSAVATAVAWWGTRFASAQATRLPASGPTSAPADASSPPLSRIDRAALVARHNIVTTAFDPATPIQVGNGEFAFTCDITGLQTLGSFHRETFPLHTMAQWAWHADPNPNGYDLDDVLTAHRVGTRDVTYATGAAASNGTTRPAATQPTATSTSPEEAAAYLRANPHRFSLAQIGFAGAKEPITPDDLSDIQQTLDLRSGIVQSRFVYKGHAVEVTTAVHPTLNLLAVRLHAPELLAAGELTVQFTFPAANANADDANRPERHRTVHREQPSGVVFERILDESKYFVRVATADGQGVSVRKAGPHTFTLKAAQDTLDLSIEFSPRPFDMPLVQAADVIAASTNHWASFWENGAAIDFAACTDARAPELERRIVLSQYLTAVNGAGSMPPPQGGLAVNDCGGKARLDLHWWHGAHFAMWNRFDLLERSLGYYRAILPQAKATAKRQGYAGARWPRSAGPVGLETPDPLGPFVLAQQPNPIYFAELAYRAKPTRETLDKYAELVDQTAQFLASFPTHDAQGKRATLGPPLVPAHVTAWTDIDTTMNPTFELAYVTWALTTAQKWRERLGLPREDDWVKLLDRLSKPTIRDGRYVLAETGGGAEPSGHPSFLMALGLLPRTHLIDESVMRETARWTKSKWKWSDAAGWDFAVLAQTATRCGDADLAIDALTLESEKNRFLSNGHNIQTDASPIALAGNGALLAAIALMAGGWEGGPDAPMPGFPKNGKWNVRCEGFTRVI